MSSPAQERRTGVQLLSAAMLLLFSGKKPERDKSIQTAKQTRTNSSMA